MTAGTPKRKISRNEQKIRAQYSAMGVFDIQSSEARDIKRHELYSKKEGTETVRERAGSHPANLHTEAGRYS